MDYRKKYLDLPLRGGEEERNSSTPHPTLSPSEAERAREAKQAKADYERDRTQADKDYEETAAAVADKAPLTPDEEAELNRLWKKLVKLYHPDRFAHEPDKLGKAVQPRMTRINTDGRRLQNPESFRE